MSRPHLSLVRAYINLDPKDKATLESHYGHGWSEHVRELIADHCEELRHGGAVDLLTIGDLDE